MIPQAEGNNTPTPPVRDCDLIAPAPPEACARHWSQTYPDGIRFLRRLLNEPRSSIWFTNKCQNNSLVNGLRFVFSTQKEPVHKSHLLMKPTTLGALRVRATIVNSLVKDVFFCNYFPLRCPRRGWKVAHETLLTFKFYSVIILGWEVWWHSFFLGWQLPPRATPVDVSRVPKPPVVLLQRGSRLPGGGRYVSSVSCVSCVSLLCPYLVSFLSSSSMIIS